MQPDRVGDVSFWYADIGLPGRRAALAGRGARAGNAVDALPAAD